MTEAPGASARPGRGVSPAPGGPPRTTRRGEGGSRRSADITRERILEAAERLFAFKGYDGTSIRDVATQAEVQIANISYHFGPKESLFETVIERRAVVMGERRMRALNRYREAAGEDPVPLENLVEGYVWPFIERSSRGGEAWKSYAQLIARMANSPRWGPTISRYYDDVAREYLAELMRTLPDATPAAIHNAFNFMVGAMLVACAETGRIERLSNGGLRSRDLETIFDDMLPFLRGGFLGVTGRRAG